LTDRQLPVDEELIPRLLANDAKAYSAVVTAYHGLMVRVARAIVGEAVADEVAQDAWLAVMRSLPDFQGRSSLKTWIMCIVGNTAKSRLRRESRHVSLESFGDIAEDSLPGRFDHTGHWSPPPGEWSVDTPEAILASDELRICIDKAIRALPPMQSTVLHLRDMQGLDMENLCKILDLTESNARVLLHRARTQIRLAIEAHQGKA
jgi:RNA polymerase sigma-70 factor (ECF subfamily)